MTHNMPNQEILVLKHESVSEDRPISDGYVSITAI
jgi:hypothetical protein